MAKETVDDEVSSHRPAPNVPGLVVVLLAGEPACVPLRLGTGFVIGRDEATFGADERLSRQHVRIEPAGPRLRVRDLGSRNGTFVDGVRIEQEISEPAVRVIRVGRTVLVPVDDVRPYEPRGVVSTERDGVVGPAHAAVLDAIARAAVSATTLLVRGESGSGKERASQAFHALGPVASGPFVPLNCATIPDGVAERLLFGARKGAYSGATDTDGLVRAAHGGVLFLDEVGELDLDVQAKLLRVIETREVLPLGATKAISVNVRFVMATHRDLRADAAVGRFRQDLFYRIDQPSVIIPPLRARPEEIPFLAKSVASLPLHAAFIEACLLRPWPGNVRELLRHTRRACEHAATMDAKELLVEHLDDEAGTPLGGAESGPIDSGALPQHDAGSLKEALRAHQGNISAAARTLGLHRTQLRRLLDRHGVERGE